MPRKKKKDRRLTLSWFSARSERAEAGASANWTRPLMWAGLTVLLGGVAVGALHVLEGRVLAGRTASVPAETRIKLAARPNWMPESIAAQIAATFLPPSAKYYDKDLPDDVRRRAAANPWVRRVIRVEKYLADPAKHPRVAIVEVEADFRMPVARVPAAPSFACVDAEGVRLPSEQVPKWASTSRARPGGTPQTTFYLTRDESPPGRALSRVHYVVVDGVTAPPPPLGQRWEGDDLAAGLRLVALISSKPYAWQITAVDVRNYGGRESQSEPHLRMYAQTGRTRRTDLRFGRFRAPEGDYNVRQGDKMSYLDEYVADHNGQLAGVNRYLDLRYDELHVSID